MRIYSHYLEDTEDTSKLRQTYPGGRKLCTHANHIGSRWLPYSEFPVLKRDYTGRIQTLKSWCKTCQRVHDRYQKGMKRCGRPFKSADSRYENGKYLNGRRLTQSERQKRYIERLKRTRPEVIEVRKQRKKEYDAFYRDKKRQLNGIRRRDRKPKGVIKGKRLPALPMCEWVRGMITRRNLDFTELAVSCGVSDKMIRNLYSFEVEYISEAIADQMLTNEGSTHLAEIYPELYHS